LQHIVVDNLFANECIISTVVVNLTNFLYLGIFTIDCNDLHDINTYSRACVVQYNFLHFYILSFRINCFENSLYLLFLQILNKLQRKNYHIYAIIWALKTKCEVYRYSILEK